MAEKKSNSNNGSKAGAIVVGIAGLTAAAVGAYYLYGHKDAAKNRAKIKGWMLKAKGEVLEELEKVQEVTESSYLAAVDAVLKKYNQLKNIDPEELSDFMAEMKAHWNGIKKTVAGETTVKKAKATVKKTAKK